MQRMTEEEWNDVKGRIFYQKENGLPAINAPVMAGNCYAYMRDKDHVEVRPAGNGNVEVITRNPHMQTWITKAVFEAYDRQLDEGITSA